MIKTLINIKHVTQALQDLPMDLNDAYEKTYKMLRSRGAGVWRQVERALIWVVYTERPLHRTEFKHALAMDSGLDIDSLSTAQEDRIISYCEGLVVIDETSQLIRLIRKAPDDVNIA